MPVKSPTVDKATSNDPFQISRLAEELESRELHPSSDSPNTPTHDLPLLVPLSHFNPLLTAPEFSIEEFLLSRAHTSLPDLRSELRDYLGSLKEELVKLINDDYAAFISLSTDLRGEGTRLERLKYPLGMLKTEIMVSSFPPSHPFSANGTESFDARRPGMNYKLSKMQSKQSSRNERFYERRRYCSFLSLRWPHSHPPQGYPSSPSQNLRVGHSPRVPLVDSSPVARKWGTCFTGTSQHQTAFTSERGNR